MNPQLHQVPGHIYELHCLFVRNYSQRHPITYQQIKRDFHQAPYPINNEITSSNELHLLSLYPYLQKYLVDIPMKSIYDLIYYYDIYESNKLTYYQFYEFISYPESLLLKNCERVRRLLEAKSIVREKELFESLSSNDSKKKGERGSSKGLKGSTARSGSRGADRGRQGSSSEKRTSISRSPERRIRENSPPKPMNREVRYTSPRPTTRNIEEAQHSPSGNKENERRRSWQEHTISSQKKITPAIILVRPGSAEANLLPAYPPPPPSMNAGSPRSKASYVNLFIKEVWQGCTSPYGVETIEQFEQRRQIAGFRDAVNQLLEFLRPPKKLLVPQNGRTQEKPKIFMSIHVMNNEEKALDQFTTRVDLDRSKTLHDVYVMSVQTKARPDEPPVFDRTFLLATERSLIEHEGNPVSDLLPLPESPYYLSQLTPTDPTASVTKLNPTANIVTY